MILISDLFVSKTFFLSVVSLQRLMSSFVYDSLFDLQVEPVVGMAEEDSEEYQKQVPDGCECSISHEVM